MTTLSAITTPTLTEDLAYWAGAKVGVSPVCQRALDHIRRLESQAGNAVEAEGNHTITDMPAGFRINWDRFSIAGRFSLCRTGRDYLSAYVLGLEDQFHLKT